jgi:drug/metabolite transporter (DMT)-like permease
MSPATPGPSARFNWLVTLVLLLVTGTLLGVSTNLAKVAGQAGVNPLAFLTWLVVGAAILLLGIGAARRRLPKVNLRTFEYFVVAGIVSVALPNLLFFAAVPRIGAGFVALAIAFPPLFTYLGALVLGLEKFQLRRAVGVAFALGGAGLLAVLKLSEPDVDPFWVAAALSGSVLLAVGNIYRTACWPKGAAPDELAPGMLVMSGLMLLVFAAVLKLTPVGMGGLSLAVPTDHVKPLLLILAQIATSSLQYMLFFKLQKSGGPVYLSLLGSVGAIVGIPIAVFFLGENVPQGIAVGGILIALGIGLLTFNAGKKPQEKNHKTR